MRIAKNMFRSMGADTSSLWRMKKGVKYAQPEKEKKKVSEIELAKGAFLFEIKQQWPCSSNLLKLQVF